MDFLLSRNVGCVCVLDISRAALNRAAARLGESARRVQWIEADVTGEWPVPTVDVWHDRTVFTSSRRTRAGNATARDSGKLFRMAAA